LKTSGPEDQQVQERLAERWHHEKAGSPPAAAKAVLEPRPKKPSWVLLRWAGDDPRREGLAGTPDRVARAFEEWFRRLSAGPSPVSQQNIEEIAGYDEIVALRDIPFESHCEHHLAPIIGRAPHRLPAEAARGRHFKACAPGRRVCQASSSPGKDDGGNRRLVWIKS